MVDLSGKTQDLGLNENADHMEQETLISWLLSLQKAGIKNIPSIAKMLAIQIGIVFFIQIIFWWDAIARYIPDIIKMPVIFLTATYNDIIPKTLFWIIIFTFGKKLLFRIKKSGFQKALRPILLLVPEFKGTFQALNQKSYSLLLIGGGIGLIIANNFASYSRFSGARNKLDKYFVALVISFTIAYLLGEGRKHWLFKFARLSSADLSRIFKFKNHYSDDATYIFLSGFVFGLLADAPLILLHLGYGGYVLGALCFLAGIAAIFLPLRTQGKNDYTG